MTYLGSLEVVSHWAAILTAIVATFAYGRYVYERFQKRRRLEEYLKNERDTGRDNGQRTVLHLVARVGMTESEILDAALRSKHIRRVVTVDDQGRADTLLLEYK